jgi:predicted dehydrogenase
MQPPTKIRVGVIGVGKMGRYHLEKYLAIPEVQVVGFFETNPERSTELEAHFKVPAFKNVVELLFEVDAITIASPTDTHATFACQAMEAGVHVLVEKPIAATLAEAENMVRVARDTKRILQVGMVERFRLAALAQDAPLHPALFVETHRLSPNLARESTIDVVADLMIHDLDLALSLVSEDPIHVSAIGMKVITAHDDLANVRLEFANGAVMNLNVSRVSAEPVRKMRVFSADAYASFDFRTNAATIVHRHSPKTPVVRKHDVPGFDPLLEQAKDFIVCIREGRRPLVAGEDGLRALKFAQVVVDKIRERERVLQSSPRPFSPETVP